MKSFIDANHLDLSQDGRFNARTAFGSLTDKDRFYNTPRCWYAGKVLSAKQYRWDGPGADFMPGSGDIPFCMKPDRKLTVEDFKYVLSSHYQNTIYDPCSIHSDPLHRGELRPIGIDRNNFLSLTQIRPDTPLDSAVLEWHAFGSNSFNAFVPSYANVNKAPAYFANTAMTVSTDSFYWANRLIAALADASYAKSREHVDRYQMKVQTEGWRIIKETDARIAAENLSGDPSIRVQEEANERIASFVRRETDGLLLKVLNESSNMMRNAFPPADGHRQ
jgi:dipeptidase